MYPIKKLREVGVITTGYTPSKLNKEFWGGSTLFIKPPHLRTDKIVTETEETLSDLGRAKGKLIKKDSIMVCCIGSLGKIGIAGENVCTNQQINSIFFDDKIVNFKYGYYFCTTLEKLMNKIANKAIIAIINKTTFSEILIPLPPLSTQSRIVARLDSAFANIDKQISLLRANIEDVENVRKSVMSKFFSDDYPIRKLSEICERITDGTHQTPTYFDSGYIFLSSKNVTSGKIDWDNIKYIDEKQHQEMYKRVTPRKGDILLAKNGTTGVAAIVDRDEIFDIYVSLALIRPKNAVLSEYLLYFINSPEAKKQFNSRLKGVGVPNLHLGEIKEVEIPLPLLPRQHEIVTHLDQVFAETALLRGEYEAQIRDLETLKQSLLEEAFAGRLVTE